MPVMLNVPRALSVMLLAVVAAMSAVDRADAADKLTALRLDYAYYSPVSLVLKKFGWVEEDFRADGVEVRWVQSAGSNRALEYLNGGSVDFASTAGLAAVLSRANGSSIKGIYVFSRPEWTALVVAKNSPIRSLADLKGKKVAATKGTDPYLFLLRALRTAGLQKSDIEHVSLQHADGRTALEQGRVDAWAGLDPHMAASELEAGSRLIYRNVSFNTYGFLNTQEQFAKDHPDVVKRVINDYERARKWIVGHPEESVTLIAEETHLPAEVVRLHLKRNDFSHPVPGREQSVALKAAAPILLEEELVRKGTDVDRVIDAWIDPEFAQAAAP